MKLEDVKAAIDSYFENISEEDLFELLTTKYNMPVIYDIDMPAISSGDKCPLPEINEMVYEPVYSNYSSADRMVNIGSSITSCEIMSSDVQSTSDSLSYAA